MIFAGIDYSMTSPSICIYNETNQLSFMNCKFYVYTNAKKIPAISNLYVTEQKSFLSQQERFDHISNWALGVVKDCSKLAIEGYSYGSSSNRLFDIGENGGLLKHKLWKASIPFDLYAPGEIKKFYSGKGNSNKDAMYEALKQSEKIDLGPKSDSPVSDIVDSYAILKLLISKLS